MKRMNLSGWRIKAAVGGIFLAAVLLLTSLVRGIPARASGLMLPGESLGTAASSVYTTEQKAAVFFKDGSETLFLSPRYRCNPGKFVWLVAVPSRPVVGILAGSLFHELTEAAPLPRPRTGMQERDYDPEGVNVFEEKNVGAYEVTVLTATTADGLESWLRTHGYAVSPRAHAPISEYVNKGWTFVACRIAEPENAKGLATGSLAPLRLRFTTSRPIYPLRLCSAQSESFTLRLYLLLPQSEVMQMPSLRYSVPLTSKPGGKGGSLTAFSLRGTLEPEQSGKRTLGSISREGMRLYGEQVRLQPTDCSADFVWATRSY